MIKDDKIVEELEQVRQERDFYHSKLMRVKEKLSEGRTSISNSH